MNVLSCQAQRPHCPHVSTVSQFRSQIATAFDQPDITDNLGLAALLEAWSSSGLLILMDNAEKIMKDDAGKPDF